MSSTRSTRSVLCNLYKVMICKLFTNLLEYTFISLISFARTNRICVCKSTKMTKLVQANTIACSSSAMLEQARDVTNQVEFWLYSEKDCITIYVCAHTHTRSANYAFTTNIEYFIGNRCMFFCKAVQLQTSLQTSQLLETVLRTSLTGSDSLNENL